MVRFYTLSTVPFYSVKHRITLVFLLLSGFLLAQDLEYRAAQSIPIYPNSDSLQFPFLGGLAMPQFNTLDLNNDQLMDLVIFDRLGEKVLTFIRVENNGQAYPYRYAPEYEAHIPALHNFAIWRDYNCDGLKDIFTTDKQSASLASLRIYLARQEVDGIRYQAMPYTLSSNNSEELIESNAFDIPAIEDINGDGDLDILHFPRVGNHIFYYENQSVEEAFECDSLHFELYEECWGGVEYSLNGLLLSACDSLHAPYSTQGRSGCAGSTLLAYDIDKDMDQDIFFSSLYDDSLSLLYNGGDQWDAFISSEDKSILLGQVSELMSFPAAFSIDYSSTTEKDLVVASNRVAEVINGKTLDRFLHYRPTADNFDLVNEHFIVDQCVDHGYRSGVATLDYNGDNLMDIVVVGNYFDPYFSTASRLHLYRNIGTATAPVFELVDNDFADLSNYTLKNVQVTFGDVDGDGDPDMVVGEKNGRLFYFENTAAIGEEAQFNQIADVFIDFDAGFFSQPQLLDYNEDGQLDIIVGSSAGPLHYLEGQAAAMLPQFERLSDSLGALYADTFGIESSPFFFQSSDSSDWQLLCGQKDGRLRLYQSVGDGLNQAFELADAQFANIDVGAYASLALCDLNADGWPEILLGNERGGLNLYIAEEKEQIVSVFPEANHDNDLRYLIHPNPTPAILYIDFPIPNLEKVYIELYKINGQRLISELVSKGQRQHRLDLSHLPAGVYYCQLRSDRGSAIERVVVH